MSEDFKIKLKKVYEKNEQWKKILNLMKFSSKSKFTTESEKSVFVSSAKFNLIVEIKFKYQNELLYYTNFVNDCKKLCISIILKKKFS